MNNQSTLDPNIIYKKLLDNMQTIQLFVSPSQYIQGWGVINLLGEYLSLCLSGCAGILITPGRNLALGDIVDRSLNNAGFTVKKTIFQGDSTLGEVERVATFFKGPNSASVLIGIGGGKCLDTARMAATRLGVHVVTIPTTASTDAPTAAHSVIYDENGVFNCIEFSATNPLMVLADLDIIAAAPIRYIIAGMGDAFSTFYEARCCMDNPEALTARGARPTMAAMAIARQCRDILLDYGTAALDEIKNHQTGNSLARIVEANILLSGLGFESGGLAGAHGVAQGLTACDDLHRNYLHGELVAIGAITQLIMEKRMDEAEQAARFFKDVGLPTHLAQLGFDPMQRGSELDKIVQQSLNVFFIRYEPLEITHSLLKSAILEANEFGKNVNSI